jgi:hypothetical protein
MSEVQKINRSVTITDINDEENSNGKVAIIGTPCEQNESGVFQMSVAMLDNIAKKSGALTTSTFVSALKKGINDFDDSELNFDAVYVTAGDVVTNNGKEVIDPETGDPMTFTKDHWRIDNFKVVLGEVASSYISRINEKADMQIAIQQKQAALNAATERRKRRNAAKKAAMKTSTPEVSLDSDDSDDESTKKTKTKNSKK